MMGEPMAMTYTDAKPSEITFESMKKAIESLTSINDSFFQEDKQTLSELKMKLSLQVVDFKHWSLLSFITAVPTYSLEYIYFVIRPRIAQWRRNQLLCKIKTTTNHQTIKES